MSLWWTCNLKCLWNLIQNIYLSYKHWWNVILRAWIHMLLEIFMNSVLIVSYVIIHGFVIRDVIYFQKFKALWWNLVFCLSCVPWVAVILGQLSSTIGIHDSLCILPVSVFTLMHYIIYCCVCFQLFALIITVKFVTIK